jgi:acetoin utilization deacetylase AcuC-like enzyme
MMQITPSGYAQMTYMLNALSGGKMLVILEGGFVAHTFLNCSVFYQALHFASS